MAFIKTVDGKYLLALDGKYIITLGEGFEFGSDVYPVEPVPSFTYPLAHGYKTLLYEFDSGAEQRRSLIRFPKKEFSMTYKYLSDSDRDILRDFFVSKKGAYEDFWFIDFLFRKWVDEYVGRSIVNEVDGAIADDGGSTTDETDEANDTTANDMTLLPATPAVDDAYYFGWITQIPDVVRLNIGTAGAGVWTITWEYYNGGGWVALSNVTDGTTGFTVSGTNDVKFDKPSDAALTTIKSISSYWVRARVSAYTSVTTQPKGTQAWVATRYYDIRGISTLDATRKIYVDGVEKTGGGTDYTIIVATGEAYADVAKFVSMQTVGALITSDFEGYLRMRGKFTDDRFLEDLIAPSLFNISTNVREVQW